MQCQLHWLYFGAGKRLAHSVHAPQCRLAFTPSPEELVEVMRVHAGRETRTPIYSFGQGCEGDLLMNPDLLVESVRQFRAGEALAR